MVDSRYYSTPQAAETLGVDVEQVLGLIHSGELAAFNVAKTGAKRPTWRIAEADLARFLMTRRSAPAPQPAVKVSKRPQPKQYV
jgi:excisionase family DNA binding protein